MRGLLEFILFSDSIHFFQLLFEKPDWHQVLRYLSRDYGIGQWPDWDVGCKKAPAKVNSPEAWPLSSPLQGQVPFPSCSVCWSPQGSWLGSALQAPGMTAEMGSRSQSRAPCQMHWFYKTSGDSFGPGDLGKYDYRADVSVFMACEELLWGFQLQLHCCLRVGFSLASPLLPHHFGVWTTGSVCTVILHISRQQPECFWILI